MEATLQVVLNVKICLQYCVICVVCDCFVSFYRQPFKFIPQTLMLQETFTIALFQKMYTLESKVLVNGNKKAIHVLTLGYQPQHPYVSSDTLQCVSASHELLY